MIEVITETLQDQIAAHDCDAPTRERLAACLPMLEQAIADWQANHAFSARPDDSGRHAAFRRRGARQRLVGSRLRS